MRKFEFVLTDKQASLLFSHIDDLIDGYSASAKDYMSDKKTMDWGIESRDNANTLMIIKDKMVENSFEV
jgi:hypothetical protein